MKYKREEMLDLNEENVKKVFGYCIATNQTPKENIHAYTFFSPNCKTNIPKMNFDKVRLAQMKKSINYMLGQLLPVHSRDLIMPIHGGFRKYTDKNWTVNRMLLFSLYYLGVATSQLPAFEQAPDSDQNFISPINRQSSLEPTFSPNDPNFEKWCRDNNIVE
ncbi:MAG: hypothetical protein IJ410_06935 [Oscillospiraceae bacterium]|nr:hypothetical protein [Oscillospiraceae bacterium]